MNRRRWLSSLGVAAAGSVAGLPAEIKSQGYTRPWALSLESFRVSDAEQLARVHSYLSGTFLPYLTQVHHGPAMFLEAIVAPHTPQALVVTAFRNFDQMIEIRSKVAADSGIQRARADLVSGDAQILLAASDALHFGEPSDRRRSGIFELRSYHAPAWHERPPAAATAAFRRAGVDPILTASAAGEHLPRFTYLVAFESLAARQEAWTTLEADREWSALEAKVTGASIYQLAPYSPVC